MSQMNEEFDHSELSIDNSRDPSPFIRIHEGALTLHFNELEVQSAMDRHAPDELLLGYTRTMMNFLSFNSNPRRIGMIGLGGGSIQKYCHRRLPSTIISVAEINPEVIALRDWFLIPKDNRRFAVHCEDGADFVRRQPRHFDVLLVDGFDNKGQPPQLCSLQFYRDCYRSLTPRGLLVANVCDRRDLISRICRAFQNRVIVTDDADDRANIVVFAGKGDILTSVRRLERTERIASGEVRSIRAGAD